MRKILLILMAFVISTVAMQAMVPASEGQAEDSKKEAAKPRKELQADRKKMRAEMQEFKVKFLAQEMDLRADQQKQFAEVYRRMSDEKHKLFHETRDLEKQISDDKEVSEEKYAEVSRALTEAKAKDAAIEKKYDAEFSKFLSAKQMFKMKTAEEKFRRRMEEMRNEREGKRVRNVRK